MYVIARASESSLLVEYNFLRKGEGCLKNALSYLLSVSRHELYEARIPVTCLKLSREIVTQGEASRLSSGDIEIKRERMRFSRRECDTTRARFPETDNFLLLRLHDLVHILQSSSIISLEFIPSFFTCYSFRAKVKVMS